MKINNRHFIQPKRNPYEEHAIDGIADIIHNNLLKYHEFFRPGQNNTIKALLRKAFNKETHRQFTQAFFAEFMYCQRAIKGPKYNFFGWTSIGVVISMASRFSIIRRCPENYLRHTPYKSGQLIKSIKEMFFIIHKKNPMIRFRLTNHHNPNYRF